MTARQETGMDWWSVTIEAQTDGHAPMDDEALEKFLDLIEPYDGSVGVGTELPTWDATISLEADSAADGLTEAVRILTVLAADAGLPVWPVVRAEVIRADVRDDRLILPPPRE
jgi:hypothetical protein